MPTRFRAPRVVVFNSQLATELGLSIPDAAHPAVASIFAGQVIPAGARPIAQAYAGHQFGGFTMLGDGRAILLGEHRAPDGRLVDIQFKGTGRTPFSRGGDGLAALGPMLREFIISEAMHALGIPTTRSLAVVATGETIWRGTQLPGAVLTRVAASHLRVGTFQFAAAFTDEDHLRAIADYTIARHDPEITDSPQPYLALLRTVIHRQAALIAQWQLVGFVHGVMNTDNMAISGETIDYGPCAFMDEYHPLTVFSSIDDGGRYAYGNQPKIAHWNLCRFAETLLPLLDPDPEAAVRIATEAIREFAPAFDRFWLEGMRRKLGLRTEEPDDLQLVQSLLDWMQTTRADFTNTFRRLATDGTLTDSQDDQHARAWQARWIKRLAREEQTPDSAVAAMCAANPALIPRNHLVENALNTATAGDLSLFNELLAALAKPFDESSPVKFRESPPAIRPRYRTFCGT